jgi:hypothetical protein
MPWPVATDSIHPIAIHTAQFFVTIVVSVTASINQETSLASAYVFLESRSHLGLAGVVWIGATALCLRAQPEFQAAVARIALSSRSIARPGSARLTCLYRVLAEEPRIPVRIHLPARVAFLANAGLSASFLQIPAKSVRTCTSISFFASFRRHMGPPRRGHKNASSILLHAICPDA